MQTFDSGGAQQRILELGQQLVAEAEAAGLATVDAHIGIVVVLARSAGHWLGACREAGMIPKDTGFEQTLAIVTGQMRETAAQNADETFSGAGFDFRSMMGGAR